ncbi:preprotein translocase subunit SecY [Candidatus Sumerlaeota bacterium]|nr:preprotein translocase subunit SecY [Candidatus Sumerlaeota bacterium]
MFKAFTDIFRVKELRDRILFTVAMIAIFRVGSFIPCPFISVDAMGEAFSKTGQGAGFFGVADMFTGGAFSKMTVMALGIMPYISASIILQLMMVVIPKLEKIAREGEAGRKKINQYTRVGTVVLALLQGFGVALWINSQNKIEGNLILPMMAEHSVLFIFITMMTVATGTTFLMWIGEKITEKGIGNGVSMVIALGITAHYPTYVHQSVVAARLESFQPIWFPIVAGLCVLATVVIILVQEGSRKIPIQHAKQVSGRRIAASQTNYLPLKINTAGVMPVIFASAILTLPGTIFAWVGSGGNQGIIAEWFSMQSRFNLYNAFNLQHEGAFLVLKAINLHTILFVVLVMFFCFFYTAIVFKSQDVADNLRRVGAFVPGYRPGKPTAEFIDTVMDRITLVGAVFLCLIALVPQFLMVSFDLPFSLADFAGGTGLIIVVAVVLDTMKQIESRMLMRHYDGFRSRRQASGGRRWAAKERKA